MVIISKPFLVAKRGSWSQAFHAQTVETGDKNTTTFCIVCSTEYSVFSECRKTKTKVVTLANHKEHT